MALPTLTQRCCLTPFLHWPCANLASQLRYLISTCILSSMHWDFTTLWKRKPSLTSSPSELSKVLFWSIKRILKKTNYAAKEDERTLSPKIQ
jgi:hypothetical protein